MVDVFLGRNIRYFLLFSVSWRFPFYSESVFEEIRLVERLKDRFNLSNEEIGVKAGLNHKTAANYLTISKGLPQQYIKLISHGSHSLRDLTITKALILARANLPADKQKEMVTLIRKNGLTRHALAKKLAASGEKKIKRVVASRTYWNELTKSLKEFARFWSEYSVLKEWETVTEFISN